MSDNCVWRSSITSVTESYSVVVFTVVDRFKLESILNITAPEAPRSVYVYAVPAGNNCISMNSMTTLMLYSRGRHLASWLV